MKIDWKGFCRQHRRKLYGRALSWCFQVQLPLAFAEEAVNEAVCRLMAANIRRECENPELRLAYIIIRNVCISEARKRYRDRRARVDQKQWENTGAVLEVILKTWLDPRPEETLHARRQLIAIFTAFEVLPFMLSRTFPKAARYLEIAWGSASPSGDAGEENGTGGPLTPAQRQQRVRGRELIRGWVDRVCHTSKGPGAADERYYKAALEAAGKYIEDEE